jgi:hypothetical protein
MVNRTHGSDANLRIAVFNMTGGERLATFGPPAGISGMPPLSRSMAALCSTLLGQAGVTILCQQPRDGGSAVKMGAFASGRIFDFTWSVGGKACFWVGAILSVAWFLPSKFR